MTQTSIQQAIKATRDYLDYIEEHQAVIKEKCANMDLLCLDIIAKDVENHDLSKLSAAEFTQYRDYFFPREGITKSKSTFDAAWKNHKNLNTHHWQTWTSYPDSVENAGYLVINVIDWIAMGFKFNNNARDYYEKNKDDITLPDGAVELMYEIFDKVYAGDREDAKE